MTPEETADVDRICISAFDSEYLADKSLAISQHEQAIKGLQQLQSSAPDKDRKKVAKKQLKFHTARLELLRKAVESGDFGTFKLLPTQKTAIDQFLAEENNITRDEQRLELYRRSQAADPNAPIPPDTIHLLTPPTPLYTPTLPDAPSSHFDIHFRTEMNGFLGVKGLWYYVKAKDPATQQTLYVLRLPQPKGAQFSWAAFYRAAGFGGGPVILVNIEHLQVKLKMTRAASYGRNFTLTSSPTVVEDKVDRPGEEDWTPRRFSYGGRQFVWKPRAGSMTGIGPNDLHEVIKAWPKPGSTSGEMVDEVVAERLSWGETKLRWTSICKVHVKGGVDQIFLEYILAMQMTKAIVELYGHPGRGSVAS